MWRLLVGLRDEIAARSQALPKDIEGRAHTVGERIVSV
jgi:hypothetical protein